MNSCNGGVVGNGCGCVVNWSVMVNGCYCGVVHISVSIVVDWSSDMMRGFVVNGSYCGMMDIVSMNVVVSVMVDSVVDSMSIVMWIVMGSLVVSNMLIWVVGIVMVLHPVIGVNKLMELIIVSMVVVLWLEVVILPVVVE